MDFFSVGVNFYKLKIISFRAYLFLYRAYKIKSETV